MNIKKLISTILSSSFKSSKCRFESVFVERIIFGWGSINCVYDHESVTFFAYPLVNHELFLKVVLVSHNENKEA